jgi:hypothetical protein
MAATPRGGLILEPTATKEIAIAALGGSAAIASVLLVFMGFLFAKAESLPSTTDDAIVARYTRLAKIGLLPLISQTVVVASAYLWLFSPGNTCYYHVWSIGFIVALILFVMYSGVVTLML